MHAPSEVPPEAKEPSLAAPDGKTKTPVRGSAELRAPAPEASVPRRRSLWPYIGSSLVFLGAVSLGIAAGNDKLVISDPWPALVVVQDFIRQWAPILGWWMVAIGLAVLVIGISWRLHRRRRRQLEARIIATCAAVTRVPQSQLRLSKTKWGRRGSGLQSTTLKYRPAEAVVSDCSAALTTALAPHSAVSLTTQWVPGRNLFSITPKPIPPQRLEDKHPSLRKLAESLAHLVGEIVIDQRRSVVNDDGTIRQMVARYQHTTRDTGEGFRQRVQSVLDAKAPSPTGYWLVTWDPAANEVTVTPAAPLPTQADYPVDLIPDLKDQMLIPLGRGDGGQLVFWEPTKLPHLLVIGPTGTGKTIFLFSLIISCLMRGWIILLLDPKELSFRGFDPRSLVGRGLPTWGGITAVATSEQEMEQAIGTFHENMRNRYSSIRGFEVSEEDLPPVLLIADEAGEMVERLSEYHTSEEKLQDLQDQAEQEGRESSSVAKPKGVKNPELRKVWSGLRLGRQSRNYVVTATQRPDVSFIPGEARSNLTTKVGLGHLDGAALEMAFNTRAVQQRVYDFVKDPVTGKTVRQRIQGRATVDVGRGPQTIQTFWVPDPGNAIMGKLKPSDEVLINKLHDLVQANRQRWASQQEAPPATGRKRRDAVQVFEKEIAEVERAEADRLASIEDTEGYTEKPASELASGEEALLEVDSILTPVVIEELEQDPYQEDDLQMTYRVTGDGPTAGELGVTSFGKNEKILILA